MILSKRPDVDRFLSKPDPAARAVLIYGRDRGVVRERGEQLCRALVPNIDDPFDVAILTDGELHLRGLIARPDGSQVITTERRGSIAEAARVVRTQCDTGRAMPSISAVSGASSAMCARACSPTTLTIPERALRALCRLAKPLPSPGPRCNRVAAGRPAIRQ